MPHVLPFLYKGNNNTKTYASILDIIQWMKKSLPHIIDVFLLLLYLLFDIFYFYKLVCRSFHFTLSPRQHNLIIVCMYVHVHRINN